MRILAIILSSAVVGTALGAAVAYVEVTKASRVIADAGAAPSAATTADKFVPIAQVDEPNFDFGSMQRGTSKSHDFVVKNVGKAPLTLSVGHTTCKCTLGNVTDQPVSPGESVNVTLEWKAKVGAGPFRQQATINTNDPIHSQLQLMVDGRVTEASGVSPPDLVFDKVQVGETREAHVFIMAMLQDELEVSDAQLSDPTTRDKFDVKIEPVEQDALPDPKAKKGVRVSVTAKPGLPLGRFNQWLELRTNLPESVKLEIPIVGQVVGDINVRGTGWDDEQGVLRLGSVESSVGKKATVNVIVRGEAAANTKFSLASTDPPELKVTIGEPKQLKPTLVHVPVTIEVPAGTRSMVRLDTAQGEEGKIVLKTTHPTVSELVLGVRFSVEK